MQGQRGNQKPGDVFLYVPGVLCIPERARVSLVIGAYPGMHSRCSDRDGDIFSTK